MLENDSELFRVNIDNYSGSLDVLLDLAKAQKVNLEDISITKLADQFHNFITENKDLNLENLPFFPPFKFSKKLSFSNG